MSSNRSISPIVGAIFLLSAATWSLCSGSAAPADTTSDDGKIPITTSSEEAKKEFLLGRDVAEKLLAQESLKHFDKAIALDPNFATAELARANSAPTAKDFFDHLKRAVSLADKVSEGERNFILANQAGANGRPAEQKQYLDKLAATYPEDERVQFNLGGYYFGQQDYDEAYELHRRLIEMGEHGAELFYNAGLIYQKRGQTEDAAVFYREALKENPNLAEALLNLGHALMDMGQEDEARSCWRKAVGAKPELAANYFEPATA